MSKLSEDLAKRFGVSEISIRDIKINGSTIEVIYWNSSGETVRKILYKKVA